MDPFKPFKLNNRPSTFDPDDPKGKGLDEAEKMASRSQSDDVQRDKPGAWGRGHRNRKVTG